MEPRKNIADILIVGGSTVGSRVAGLVRDMLIYSLLGMSVYNSAFLFAFTLPNLFRRLLGEGALTSAFIPVLSSELENKGSSAFFSLINKVASRVLLVLVALTLAGCGVLLGMDALIELEARWHLAFKLGALLFPYAFLVCLSAVCGGALNNLGRFGTVAMTPIVLNICMITSLGIGGFWLGLDKLGTVLWLCGGVLVGGFLQFALPARALYRQGWRPMLDLRGSPELRRTWELFVPGVIGASVLQFNLLVSRLLAFAVEQGGMAVLFLASRLVELPLGIFSIAVITVIFPQISKFYAQGDVTGFHQSFGRGLRYILILTLPATAGLFVLAEPILNLLFGWGLAKGDGIARTVPILQVSVLGMPFFSAVALYTRGYHARQDMKTPLHSSYQAVIVNLVLSVLLGLILQLGILGLALAGVLASAWQCLYLWSRSGIPLPGVGATLIKVLVSTTIMGTACWFAWFGVSHWLNLTLIDWLPSEKVNSLIAVVGIIPAGVFIYGSCLWLLQLEDLQAVKNLLFRWKRKED
ncbi:MAG: murein biosynthesis integral membrane protein MurJ [Opitutae bacterium]|nr:murein biosynthesis integral membrane protein MurJ [Opitutae bacterium]MBT5379474.1 murein biosynthesis integral membrane protein MurJ [Opitutae bacterium]MBT5691734.1 murein biosynthesis integral membrane protein MurJ [Opitutae bacterium]MBT6461267.1 murein biosynthesis integral membrane protein MurJ [Opitutae bacterium]MBT6958861.1 murein biosynthesis integral membrane protein MurJ [Opitutae bacterium]